MITLLKHFDKSIARSIRTVFQKSYAVEAQLLHAIDFPPLKRPLAAFTKCQNDFWGFYIKNELVAVVEIHDDHIVHVQSMVVHPDYFRTGIAMQLMKHIFKYYQSTCYTVETGLKNVPAISLYEKCGFIKIKEWDTDHGVRKIRMSLQVDK